MHKNALQKATHFCLMVRKGRVFYGKDGWHEFCNYSNADRYFEKQVMRC